VAPQCTLLQYSITLTYEFSEDHALERSIYVTLQSRPNPGTRRRQPPQTRILLPVLTQYGFNEYLEDLVAQIDAPLLDCL
jgi:hypothetical protein